MFACLLRECLDFKFLLPIKFLPRVNTQFFSLNGCGPEQQNAGPENHAKDLIDSSIDFLRFSITF